MTDDITKLSLNIKVPTNSSRLWKDECCYSFDTPEKDTGLYIDLISLLSFSKKFIPLNHQKTGHNLYLNFRKVELPPSSPKGVSTHSDQQHAPKKLAIGVEGGFDANEEEIKYEDKYQLYIFPVDKYIDINDKEIPHNVKECCEKIMTMNTQSRKEEVMSWNAENVLASAYAESIIQLETTRKINPKGPWNCDIEGCDKKENLWLNLTDGFIGCGRKYADGTGGNGHAQKHYDETKYPISVKLGTITKDHSDVYSYPEDDMVSDPLLTQHLAHFGLDPKAMSKTEKSMAELELDQNLNYEFGKLQEKGRVLENVFGPGLTGIENLGNSCYMSSVLQMLFAIPDFQTRYLFDREKSYKEITQDPTLSFEIQMSKLAYGLLSGDYSVPAPKNATKNKEEFDIASQVGIAPKMYKSLVSSNHPAFSTMQQQDALEYFTYLLEYIERAEVIRPSWIQQSNPLQTFQFHLQERIQCGTSGKVKYTNRVENYISLPVPLEDAINKEQVAQYEAEVEAIKASGEKVPADKEEVRPIIPLTSCIQRFVEPYKVDDFYSSAIKSKTFAINSSKLATLPETLVLHMRKYVFNPDYTPKKLNVCIDVPDFLDIEHVRGFGKQDNEEELPEDNGGGNDEPEFDQAILDFLLSMDFPLVRCKKALVATGGKDAEAAMEWIFKHTDDPDIDVEPTPKPKTNTTSSQPTFSQDSIDSLCSMGFTEKQVKHALKNTSGNVERAGDWLFSHMDELDSITEENVVAPSSSSSSSTTAASKLKDGSGKYKLLGFITHIGNNAQHGHYVCHIVKDGKWIKFNDRHVQLSQDPPKDMGYIYFYQRC
ncbi:hypothetical protein CYY_005352 [Polysphondylium violaceum]|uniref:Ubiquitin carboxyl-terminal hydrolase n=1 Tax=Polysphondylium violaceum TaxID=133409 RepID=A0A8J4V6X8_9MYCE|nr:hypothetical protein CYY_005352 [Polysphondylium violaceum]